MKTAVVILAILALAFFVSYYIGCNGCSTDERIVYVTNTETDTVVEYVPGDTIYITKAQPSRFRVKSDSLVAWTDTIRLTDTTFQLDTIFLAQPFESTLDTILQGDTVLTAFSYPPAHHSLILRQKPDSFRTIIQTITIPQPDPWYLRAGYAGLGSAATLIGIGIYQLAH